MNDFLNTREVAAYLRVRERKIYELVGQRRIPCSRVAGKWLFPRRLVDAWVLAGVEGGADPSLAAPRPPILAGSHDPLLEWAVREAGCELAVMFDGSMDGLARFAARRALVSGCHVPDPDDGEYNLAAVQQLAIPDPAVMLAWARREQGLIVARGNPLGLRDVRDIVGRGARFIGRQTGAGSALLFEQHLRAAGAAPEEVRFVTPAARSETDVALAVQTGNADVGLGIAATVTRFGLDFVALTRERYDLLVGRRDYFEPPFQRLLGFTRTPEFRRRAQQLGGYDVSELGAVRWNAPGL